jgi:monovalent cation:proton antiporter-2 (CPA2) family protein
VTLELLLRNAAIYLAAGVVAVPIAARLGLGSVLGYLLAGVVIGPWVLNVGADSATVLQFAEFGVVMMLFLVGLELEPARLWRLRGPVFGLGGLQVAGTAAVAAPIAMAFGLPWQQAVALGFILAMSSTAIALQSLTEKGLLQTTAGQTAFSLLLFQDVSVIPILALFPLLATLPGTGGEVEGGSALDGLPAWQHGLLVAGAVVAVIAVGRLAVGPLMRAIARTGLREMFTAASLLIVLAVALLMSAVGLSAALGTFIAGVVLANSEYRHEITADVEPFKGLLLGLFFTAVGASIDFDVLAAAPVRIALLCLGVLAAKAAVLAVIGRIGGLKAEQGALLALALAQVGEFAFVLFSFAAANGILPTSVTVPMVTVTAFSMAATPFLLTFHERVLGPRLAAGGEGPTREQSVVDEHAPVIMAGFGRFGQIATRLMRTHGIDVTVLDVDSETVDVVGKFGQKAHYGDASRLDLLHAAGASGAKVLVVAVDDPAKAVEIVHTVQKHFPHLAILARAKGRTEAYDLLETGVEGVYRETFDTAIRVGADAMRLLGTPAHAAARAARLFARHDEAAMRELAEHRNDQAFVSKVRERIRDVAQVLRADHAGAAPEADVGWDSEGLRAAVPVARAAGAEGQRES